MDSKSFYKNLNPLATFDKFATDELLKIQEEYPYFQLASIISLKAVKQNKTTYYKSHLAKVATKVISREVLFDFLYPEYQQAIETKVEPIVAKKEVVVSEPQKPVSKTVEANELINTAPSKIEPSKDIKSKSELMEEVKARLSEIKVESKTTEKSHISKEKESTEVNPKKITSEKENNSLDKEKPAKHASLSKPKKEIKPIDRGSYSNIIANFIKTNPSINRPEDKTYDEEIALANKSLEESYDLVSETMAELFVKQGHIKKAIKVYEKLILISPEKSTYFAARILKLKN